MSTRLAPGDTDATALDRPGASGPSLVPVTAVLAALTALVASRPLKDNSFLTHLATGRLIVDDAVPTADRFTWASEGTPLVAHSWGSSVLYTLGDRIGSGAGVRVLIALATGAGMLALWRLAAPAKANVLRLALVSVSLVLGFAWWNERPQTFGYLALALGLVIVCDKRSPWLLVPLFFVWTNLHGSFAMGVPFLGALMGLRVVEERRLGRREFAEIGAMLAGIAAAGLVNPYGWDLIAFPVQQLQRESLVLISEWRPLPFDSIWNLIFVGQAALSVGVLAWRRRWLRLALSLGLVWLALDAARYAPLTAIMLVPIVAPGLAGIGTEVVAPAIRARTRWGVVGLGAAVVLALIAVTPSYDLVAYPDAEAAAMQERGWLGRERSELPRVLTHDFVGNYLEWRNGVQAKPWIDDRAEVHTFDTLRDYSALLGDSADHEAILERNPHDVVVWQAEEAFAEVVRADARYEIVSDTDDWLVACVRTSGFCPAA